MTHFCRSANQSRANSQQKHPLWKVIYYILFFLFWRRLSSICSFSIQMSPVTSVWYETVCTNSNTQKKRVYTLLSVVLLNVILNSISPSLWLTQFDVGVNKNKRNQSVFIPVTMCRWVFLLRQWLTLCCKCSKTLRVRVKMLNTVSINYNQSIYSLMEFRLRLLTMTPTVNLIQSHTG